MIEQNIEGKIRAVTENGYRISIDTDDQECHSCGLKGYCNTQYVEIGKTDANQDLHQGQKVRLTYSRVIQTSFILYMLPLIFFFLGIILAQSFLHVQNELIMFVCALLSMGLAFLIVHVINNKYGSSKYKVRIEPLTR